MHAIQHSFAHRAQPATRTLRWQPYSSCTPIPGAAQAAPGMVIHNLQHPRSPQLTKSYPIPATQPTSPIEYLHFKPQFPAPTIPSAHIKGPTPINEASTSSALPGKDATSAQKRHLADQAVASLCDIWRTQDIPQVFLVTSAPPITSGASQHLNQPRHLPTIDATPQFSSQGPSCHGAPPTTSPLTACNQASAHALAESNLVSIKAFVYEVLRRSKTSGSVLQTALCYLEAIRSQVNVLQQREKAGLGSKGEVDQGNKIVKFDDLSEEEKQRIRQLEEEEAAQDAMIDSGCFDGTAATVRVIDDLELPGPATSFSIPITGQCLNTASFNASNSSFPSNASDSAVANLTRSLPGPSAPQPPSLPSPLLCPRRAFLAALILATKFSQDRCYSNKAWAKLSGLPPREIGRCERALGHALDWRMWVGKGDAPKSEAPVETTPAFKVARSYPDPSGVPEVAVSYAPESGPARTARRHSGLRRARSQVFSPVAIRPEAQAGIPRRHSPPAQPRSSLHRSYTSGQLPYPIPLVQDSSSPNSTTSTPTLSHSPSSTDGSSYGGDQTIHVSNFLDIETRWDAKSVHPPIAFDPELLHDRGIHYGRVDGSGFSEVVY